MSDDREAAHLRAGIAKRQRERHRIAITGGVHRQQRQLAQFLDCVGGKRGVQRGERCGGWSHGRRIESEQRFESARCAGSHACVGIGEATGQQRFRGCVKRFRAADRFVNHRAHRCVLLGAKQRCVVVHHAHLRQRACGGTTDPRVRRLEERDDIIAVRRIFDATDRARREPLCARIVARHRGAQRRHSRFARVFGFENRAVHRDLRGEHGEKK